VWEDIHVRQFSEASVPRGHHNFRADHPYTIILSDSEDDAVFSDDNGMEQAGVNDFVNRSVSRLTSTQWVATKSRVTSEAVEGSARAIVLPAPEERTSTSVPPAANGCDAFSPFLFEPDHVDRNSLMGKAIANIRQSLLDFPGDYYWVQLLVAIYIAHLDRYVVMSNELD
jgi:hypothetical protein